MDLPAVMIIALIGSFLYSKHLQTKRFTAVQQAKSDRFRSIVEKFKDKDELEAFLRSRHGIELFQVISSVRNGTKVPIIAFFSLGVLAFFVSIGVSVVAYQVDDEMMMPAILLFFISIGLMGAAYFAYKMSKKWGVFESSLDKTIERSDETV